MANETFPVEKSEKEWREVLSADQFRVLREHGTERAGASPLNFEKRTGVFHCAACGQPLFESSTKYESGSGWPSFWQPLPERRGHQLGHDARHDARGSSLQELRRPSRPRVRRRPRAHRSALLHERRVAQVRARCRAGKPGKLRQIGQVWVRQLAGVSRFPARHLSICGASAAARVVCQYPIP